MCSCSKLFNSLFNLSKISFSFVLSNLNKVDVLLNYYHKNNIKETYIDSTRIVSPTIEGGTIKASASDEKYAQMSANGLGIYTRNGGYPNARFGYETGNAATPFITLGQGVDSAGTDAGMVKKFSGGVWIGDNDAQFSSSPSGTGFYIDIANSQLYKSINGVMTEIGFGVFG